MKIKNFDRSYENVRHASSPQSADHQKSTKRRANPTQTSNLTPHGNLPLRNEPSSRKRMSQEATPSTQGEQERTFSTKGFLRRIGNSISRVVKPPRIPGPLGNIPLPNPSLPNPGAILDTIGGVADSGNILKPEISAGDIKRIRESVQILNRRINRVRRDIDNAVELKGKAPALLVDRLRRLEQKAEQLASALPIASRPKNM